MAAPRLSANNKWGHPMTEAERKQATKDKVQLGFVIGMAILFLCKVIGGCISDARKEAAEERQRQRAAEEAERERRRQADIHLYKDSDKVKPYLPRTELEVKYYQQYQKKKAEGL